MRAAVALLLHILSVHYLFVLFIAGLPCLALGVYLKNKPKFSRYYIPQLLIAIFLICLFGEIIFPRINFWYLENYGMRGEAVIVKSSQEAGWFQKTPDVRLTLQIQPDEGASFVESVTTAPPLDTISRLQVGDRLQVLYAPQYTHDIAVADW